MENEQQVKQPLDPAISDYILANCQNQPRHVIERALVKKGHNQFDINETWEGLLQKRLILPMNQPRQPHPRLWAGLVVVVVAAVILSLLFGPKTQPTVYRNPEQLRNEAKIGEKAMLVIRNTGTMITCQKTAEDLTECFWRMKPESTTGVIIRFPKSKNLAPSSAGFYNEVKVLERQGDKLITEIEREYDVLPNR